MGNIVAVNLDQARPRLQAIDIEHVHRESNVVVSSVGSRFRASAEILSFGLPERGLARILVFVFRHFSSSGDHEGDPRSINDCGFAVKIESNNRPGSVSRRRFAATSQYFSSRSMRMALRPFSLAATPVVPLPAKGSRMVSPWSVKSRIKSTIRPRGFCVVWYRPSALCPVTIGQS